MLHNPNVKPAAESVLEPYYRGSTEDMPWPKLEEYSYQLFLDGEVFIPEGDETMHRFFEILQEEAWMYSEEDNIRIVQEESIKGEGFVHFKASEPARDLLDVIFQGYERIFMD